MKMKVYTLAMALLFMLSIAACAEMIIFSDDESKAKFEIPIDDILDREWILSQVDNAPNEFDELIIALYIMNTYQYGPAQNYEEIADTELTIDGLCKWLDLMSFECQYEEISEGVKLIISDNIQIDVYAKENVIYRMDLVIKIIDNGYGNDLIVTVVK